MNSAAFKQLLKKYIDGTATDEEQVLVHQWYELLYDCNLPDLSAPELGEIEQQVWQHIATNGGLSARATAKAGARWSPKRWWITGIAAAAIITGIIIAGARLLSGPQKSVDHETHYQLSPLLETVNSSDSIKKVSLQDGSYVLLQPSSKLSYPVHFEKGKREVYLEGAAFFEIAKDADNPFYVYTYELVTKVLGTSFMVQAFARDTTIKVIVHTGKVTVYQRTTPNQLSKTAPLDALVIWPNQQAVFNRQQAVIIKTITQQPQVLTDTNNGRMVFTNTPVSKVLATLQKLYGIDIIYNEALLGHCSFTGSFTNENFFEKIDLVCKAIEASYTQTDGQLVITAAGCDNRKQH